MDPASLPNYHEMAPGGWIALRLALGLLLLLPIIVGMVGAGLRAWLKRHATRRVHGVGPRNTRSRPVERPVADWPERRVTVPLARDVVERSLIHI